MAYADVAALAADPDFAARTQACYATETLGDPGSSPGSWQPEHAWEMAAQPGFGDAYASAIESGVDRPGNDPAVITDPQILSAVQSLMSVQD